MLEKILFIDDEENILLAFKRQLRNKFEIETTNSGRDAIFMIQEKTYAVIVSDLRMPVMDGIQFFSQARQISPDSVRILLTGHADLNTAIEAINEGHIFRFLTKPCSQELLTRSIEAAKEQYRLITAEKELLENTLSKTVQLMMDMLSLSNPFAFGRALRIKRIVKEIAGNLDVSGTWQFELAAMLSQIGCVALPKEVLEKVYSRKPLEKNEISMYRSHPLIGHRLLKNIPRLEPIAQMVKDQYREFTSYADQPYSIESSDVDLGAQILRVASDYEQLIHYGLSHEETVSRMRQKTRIYDSEIVEALGKNTILIDNLQAATVDSKSIRQGMILTEDVYTKDGELLISKGLELSTALLELMKLARENKGLIEPIRVMYKPNSTSFDPDTA